MSDHLAEQPTASDRVVTWIRRLRVPIVLFWMFLATATNVFVPQLEKVGEEHNVALSPLPAPSMNAFKRIGAGRIIWPLRRRLAYIYPTHGRAHQSVVLIVCTTLFRGRTVG